MQVFKFILVIAAAAVLIFFIGEADKGAPCDGLQSNVCQPQAK